MADISSRVAERLKKVMLSKGLSQSDIARATGLTHPTVNAFCNGRGKPVNASLLAIAEAVGISVEDLLAPDAPQITPDELAEAAAMRALKAFTQQQQPQPILRAAEDFSEALGTHDDPTAQIAVAELKAILAKLSLRPHLLTQAAMFLQSIVDVNAAELAAVEQKTQKKRG